LVEAVANNSNDIGTYVKLSGLNVDLSQGFVEPVKGLFVREAFADAVKQVEQNTAGVLGTGTRFVKPASTRNLAGYDVALLARAIGTSGQLIKSTTYQGQRVVEYYQYLRPSAKFAGTVMSAVAVARELATKGVPWTALVIVYPTAGTRIKKPMVLHVKGIWAYYIRYHSTAGVRLYPDVRLYFTKQVLGLRKRTPYTFDLMVLYSSKPLQRAVSKFELAEKSLTQIPPPSIAVVPAQPRQKAKAPTAAKAVAQPTTAVAMPRVEVVPQQQPTAQAPQPATVDSGKYVKPTEGGEGSGGHYVKLAEELERELEESKRELSEIRQSLADIDSGNIEAAIKRLREAQKHINL
jgi:hypothetical protein